MDIESSQQAKALSRPVASSDGAYVASLLGSRLQIRATCSLSIVRSIPLPSTLNVKNLPIVRWSPLHSHSDRIHRVLLADETNVRVWDLRDGQWSAVINNGSGGMGKIVNAEFGPSADEVLVFSDFAARLTVWSLSGGRSVEIKDPKFSKDAASICFKPGDGVLALLSRPGSQDTLTLHAPKTYLVLKTVALPSTDARGLKWSPDGKWLAIWDTPSMGLRVMIYTADGYLYRTYTGEDDGGLRGLGIKTVSWSPKSDFLAVGSYDSRVTLLGTRTFSPIVFLDHTPLVQLAGGNVWQEQVPATSKRDYTIAAQPIEAPVVPATASQPLSKVGISVVIFNGDGTLVATRDDSMPTCVWIWDLARLAARTVLIQHAPVKSLSWHPNIPNLLLVQCAHDEPVVYLWEAAENRPRIVKTAFKKSNGKMEAGWLAGNVQRKPALLFGDLHGFITLWPDGKDTILKFDRSESRPGTPGSANGSDDSLYNILTGRTPMPALEDSTNYEDMEESGDSVELEDTFHGKGQLQETLGESECF
ncbi:uncharacterized protein IWZ02DRAFT_488891 [Phyllosticta citriasiana]|uniref:uncharacterized protein n=1 Tax=Phyllosticta citriasiana TaxID=595635 RepID=UPI0030FD5FBD